MLRPQSLVVHSSRKRKLVIQMKLFATILFLVALFTVPVEVEAQCAGGQCGVIRGRAPVRTVLRAAPIRSRVFFWRAR